MKDDSDRLRDGELPANPFADTELISTNGNGQPSSDVDLEYQPFPTEALPEPVRSFVTTAAAAIGCDPAYVALPLIGGLSAAIGNTRRLRVKGGWVEPPVVWAGIIGESGTQKSPAIDAAIAPLKRVQEAAMEKYASEKTDYDEQMEQYKEAERERRHNRQVPVLTKPTPPTPWRILCSDVTVEALARLLQNANRGVLVGRDELSGWIAGFDQYKSSRGADAAHWLTMHRAGDLLVDRKTEGETTYVPYAAVCVVGGIQPEILKRALGREHLENGLAARLLLAYPPRSQKVWTEADISKEAQAGLTHLYRHLLDLDFAEVDGKPVPLELSLTPRGKEELVEFVNEHGQEQARFSGHIAAAYSKLEAYGVRLALLVHSIRCAAKNPSVTDEKGVDEESVRAAVTMVRWFARETARIYTLLGVATPATPQEELVDLIRSRGGSITPRELRRTSRRFGDRIDDVRAALNELVESGLGEWRLGDRPANPDQRGAKFHIHNPVTLSTVDTSAPNGASSHGETGCGSDT